MDLQKLMDTMSASMRGVRSDYHLTLGKLIKMLELADKNVLVAFSDGSYPNEEMSYRGYYSDLAFDSKPEPTTAGELLAICKKALNAEYTGYKGGEFLMDEKTPLWKSEYGTCGEAIVGFDTKDDKLVLVCKPEED